MRRIDRLFAGRIAPAIAVLFAAACGIFWASEKTNGDGAFSLVASDGSIVTDKTYRGKWELIFFGYTHCPDVCPTTLTAMSEAIAKLGPLANRVQPIFVSIDPHRDSPAVLRDYLSNFDGRIVGLTGDIASVKHAASRFNVYFARYDTGTGPDDYSMDHSNLLYVVDPMGHSEGAFVTDDSGDALVDGLRPLLSQSFIRRLLRYDVGPGSD